MQAAGLLLTALTRHFEYWLIGSILLGIGTTMVYPCLIAAVSDASHPTWRARSLSVYRFWRDLGYATLGRNHRGYFRNSLGDRRNCDADIRLGRGRRLLMREPRRGVNQGLGMC